MVIGSLNMDLVAYVPHHPLPGETLTADHFATSPGGKGANQAVACSKLSRRRDVSDLVEDPGPAAYVAMVGCVGKDDYGARLKQSLCDYGVHVHGVERREGVQTGVALIIVDGPTGENRIVLHPGANHALVPADLAMRIELDVNEDSLREGQDWRVPDLFILQLEIPFETVLAVLRIAGRARDVLLNPAPARKLPDAVYDGLAHLVLNETEAAILGEVEQASLDDEKGLQTVAERFVDKGVRNVIITLGGRGAYYMSSDGRKGLVPAEKAKVVDTTAAGDTFVGQYALEVVGKQQTEIDIEAAVRKANRAAAKTVERAGAQDSIPWREELE
ncbi:Ribokinase-like protein [Chaetomium strumarium]|uniref:Ribokinase n=1 Tax=Chaetomium strumarium TaxID=1170767 RepID=A0AAJ0GV42_9PEZI|nr:Ribokinase-like protein [Chaetomium strumarium]